MRELFFFFLFFRKTVGKRAFQFFLCDAKPQNLSFGTWPLLRTTDRPLPISLRDPFAIRSRRTTRLSSRGPRGRRNVCSIGKIAPVCSRRKSGMSRETVFSKETSPNSGTFRNLERRWRNSGIEDVTSAGFTIIPRIIVRGRLEFFISLPSFLLHLEHVRWWIIDGARRSRL